MSIYEADGEEPKCRNGEGRLVGDKTDAKLGDERITASSYYAEDEGHGKGNMWRSRLDNADTTWCAHENKKGQWIQYEFPQLTTITKVMTKGRQNCCNQWVTKYQIMYSEDGGSWTTFPHVFNGNTGPNDLANHNIIPNIKALFVRISVQEWHNHISMRADFEGCKWEPKPTTTTKPPPIAKGGASSLNTRLLRFLWIVPLLARLI